MSDLSNMKRGALAAMIRAAGKGELPRGWLCLADAEAKPSTNCILLVNDDDLEEVAAALGYPIVSLDTDTMEDIFRGAGRLAEKPTDEQLLRCFRYYVDFDAFIPSFDAPDPPPVEEALRLMDRQFYDSLGAERENVACRSPLCGRGAITYGVFCRPHHFENVKGRTCPFTD